MLDLTKYKWEKYVGRRQPPFRIELILSGLLKWLQDNGFKGDYSNLLVFYSDITEKGIISDAYINIDLRKKIVDLFKERLQADLSYANRIVEVFIRRTQKLEEVSLNIKEETNYKELFDDFCEAWEDFGAPLYVPLLLIEAIEQIILKDYKNDLEAPTKLMKQVSAKVNSEFFSVSKNNESFDFFPEEYKPYIDLMSKLMEYRDSRKLVYEKCWYEHSAAFFRYLEDISGLGEKVFYLSKQQIQGLLKNNSSFEVNLPSFIYVEDSEIKFEFSDSARKLNEAITKLTTFFDGELKGIVASKGKAQGKVRLIQPHVHDQRFEKGEILITTMTTPDLMPQISIASAIVTDEGGLTCHAAIVSRELKKPCIIATKIASRVFKDGDLVEVDAERGVVRKLK